MIGRFQVSMDEYYQSFAVCLSRLSLTRTRLVSSADAGELPVPVLSIENVSFGYPGGKELYSNVDFGVDLQTRVALVGPNGAGKVCRGAVYLVARSDSSLLLARLDMVDSHDSDVLFRRRP